MAEETKQFTLLSGVEAEIKMLSGKHQRMLTERKNKKHTDNLNDMLVDLLVRVGDNHNVDEDFVKSMLSADRRKCLVVARQFSLEIEPDETLPKNDEYNQLARDSKIFNFDWAYLDNNGEKQKSEQSVDLSDGFPEHKYKEQFTNYTELRKTVEVVLPQGKIKARFKMLDGWSEELAANLKKDEQSSHTTLIMRNVQIEHQASKEKVWIQADLDRMSLINIEYLRKKIKEYEGRIDTEFMFMHPEADTKPQNEKEVVVDLLSVTAFFFPSQAV